MIFDLLWGFVEFLLSPLQALPVVDVSVVQFAPMLVFMTNANRFIDMPLIFHTVSVIMLVFIICVPVAWILKTYNALRGAG